MTKGENVTKYFDIKVHYLYYDNRSATVDSWMHYSRWIVDSKTAVTQAATDKQQSGMAAPFFIHPWSAHTETPSHVPCHKTWCVIVVSLSVIKPVTDSMQCSAAPIPFDCHFNCFSSPYSHLTRLLCSINLFNSRGNNVSIQTCKYGIY